MKYFSGLFYELIRICNEVCIWISNYIHIICMMLLSVHKNIKNILISINRRLLERPQLTHWGRVTHICVGNLTIIGSDNGLSPGRRQAITWTNVEILLIGPLGTNFNAILIGIQTFSFKKMHLKMSSVKWRPFFLGLNVLRSFHTHTHIFHMQINTALPMNTPPHPHI